MARQYSGENSEHNINTRLENLPFEKNTEKQKKVRKSPRPKKGKSLSEKIAEVLESEKTARTTGFFLILLSFYLVLAFSSFIFTGTEDFDKIQHSTIIDFLFDSEIEVEYCL